MNNQNQWLFEAPFASEAAYEVPLYFGYEKLNEASGVNCETCFPGTTKCSDFLLPGQVNRAGFEINHFMTGDATPCNLGAYPTQISSIARVIRRANPGDVISIVGHTDHLPVKPRSRPYDNVSLGLDRALKVKDDLIEALKSPTMPDPTRVFIFNHSSRGAQDLKYKSVPEGCSCNRRVEVFITSVSGASASTSAAPKATLYPGSQGASVREVQIGLNQWLASKRYTGTPQLIVDGIFGRNTTVAVRAFQQSKGLAADGIVGPQTWRILLAMQSLMRNRRARVR
jgi:Putative peptidoglycan binding domain